MRDTATGTVSRKIAQPLCRLPFLRYGAEGAFSSVRRRALEERTSPPDELRCETAREAVHGLRDGRAGAHAPQPRSLSAAIEGSPGTIMTFRGSSVPATNAAIVAESLTLGTKIPSHPASR